MNPKIAYFRHIKPKIFMISFKPITPSDKNIINTFILPSGQQDCDLSFANLCSWQFMSETAYAVIDNHLVIRFTSEEGIHEYFMPFGCGSIISVIDRLDECAHAAGVPLILRGILPGTRELLEQYYPTLFEYTADRDYFDYIYRRQDLAELKGKNYQPKRNHVNKFKKEYRFDYQPLTPELIPECLEFEAAWCNAHGYEENENIRKERQALTFALDHFDELGLSGAVIRVEGRVVAFTFGAPISSDTFGVHFEKATIHVDGAYSIINQEFVTHLPEQYIWINREEDMGIPGLRQAKMSYHPAYLLEKCKAVKRN